MGMGSVVKLLNSHNTMYWGNEHPWEKPVWCSLGYLSAGRAAGIVIADAKFGPEQFPGTFCEVGKQEKHGRYKLILHLLDILFFIKLVIS